MVGTNTKMTFAEMIGRELGKPYTEGGLGDSSYDCMGLLASLYWKRGLEFPDHFEKWNRNNYFHYYRNDEKGALKTAIRFFDSFLERIHGGKVAGDILLIRQPKGTEFIGLYTGNNHAVTSFIRLGVRVFRLDEANKPVIIWRSKCQQKQQP